MDSEKSSSVALNLDDSPSISKRRKDLFGDCALVEIIHLHDCLRGALKALEKDVCDLSRTVLKGDRNQELNDLECRVAGRFKVIWSVFRAHSSAEDEFIWPTLQSKTQNRVKGSPSYRPDSASHPASYSTPTSQQQQWQQHVTNHGQQQNQSEARAPTRSEVRAETLSTPNTSCDDVMDQEAYEEDHADEERMFSRMDNLLTQLRAGLLRQKQVVTSAVADGHSVHSLSSPNSRNTESVDEIMKSIHALTKTLSQHLMAHLEKEEKQCMPLVVKHLSKSEIHDLVGKIMGQRSSDMIAQIMTMAVQNLNQADREEMVKYMKQAMAGTFFDRWLSMSGWMNDIDSNNDSTCDVESSKADENLTAENRSNVPPNDQEGQFSLSSKRIKRESSFTPISVASGAIASTVPANPAGEITSQAELERLIRAIATNNNLTPRQKNTTIQGLRDSVWKSNQKLRQASSLADGVDTDLGASRNFTSCDVSSAVVSPTCTPARRVTPPSVYYKKNTDGKLEVVWNSVGPTARCPEDGSVPLFSASELAPTYHDGATGAVLGCPHYARACKLRHPVSGRLYTCRLCCEQEREMPSKDRDEKLDRYAVREVMCMKCNALQPVEDRCINPTCESQGRPFAKYFCRICNLYDDRPRPIFHCPYCNTCRMGLGLGIDFRHCMRCNACVAIADIDHRCIPQKLQGSCPICHESLFQSTEPLRGLRCGHVMHLYCFTEYRRGQNYTCPLCMRCMEDMADYFALLDAAVRMQPMPAAYLSTMSNIYCQDCEKCGSVKYHFVGLKCPHCGSYNTREMGRLQTTDSC